MDHLSQRKMQLLDAIHLPVHFQKNYSTGLIYLFQLLDELPMIYGAAFHLYSE